MSFTVLTYNILDFNLASNTILRTMSDTHKKKLIDLVTKENIQKMELMYKDYFHSDTKGKSDKNFKRKLWGENIINETSLNLFKTNFNLNLDHIKFEDNKLKIGDDIVQNLKMLMIEYSKDKSKVDELHNIILKMDKEIMDWNVRGHKIAQVIINSGADIVMLQEYGSCHEKKYQLDGKDIRLQDELYDNGYNHIFFLNIKYKKDAPTPEEGKEGVIIYYRRDNFKIATLKQSLKIEERLVIDVDTVNPDYDYLRVFDIDETVINKEIYVKNRDNSIYTDSSTGKKIQFNTNFLVANKRAVGFVKFEHIESKNKVLAITSHLLTDSYDKYGLVKIEELKFVKNKLEELMIAEILNPKIEGVIFGGDFNIRYTKPGKAIPYSDRSIFQSIYSCDFDGTMIIGDRDDKKLFLEDIIKNSPTDIVSSVNGTRKEWIDYIFFNNIALEKKRLIYEILEEGITIPDNIHPSDHIPIMAEFIFKTQSGGYYQKYLKYKQKYIKLKKIVSF
jgi:hypothetical protein